MSAPAALRRSPLDAAHRALGARMVPFAGYEMPLRYGSELDEHRSVRTALGVFDLSHMGEVALRGPDALALARFALVSDPSTLQPGQAQYSMACAADGGVIDDLIVYRADDGYLVVCNAANRDAVVAQFRALLAERGLDAVVDDRSDATALIAPQGPRAAEAIGALTDLDLGQLRNYWSARGSVAGIRCLVARTGYTGEDGFELFCDIADAPALWDVVLDAARSRGGVPCGLASRDTLRLEAGMPLYGNELNRETNPYEANLGRVVKLDKGEFVGREALAEVQRVGPRRRLVGLALGAGMIARHGYPVMSADAGEELGTVTSGTHSPTLGHPIAMALVRADAAEGQSLAVMIRDRACASEQVKLPFYRRPRPAEEPKS